MTRDIILVHEDPDFVSYFREKLSKNGTRITAFKTINDLPEKPFLPQSVIVIDTEKDWDHAISTLQSLREKGQPFYAIVSTSALLQKTIAQIESTSKQLALNGKLPTQNRRKTDPAKKEASFAELLEKRLAGFVKKVRSSQGSNLYDLLIQEVEKPLIKLALEETRGNQVQASQLLGMHRNTLRKKMKELKISAVKNLR